MKKTVLVVLAVLLSSISYSQSGWVRVTDSISNFTIHKIQFTSENTGYACGSPDNTSLGVILKTTNAGLNWQTTHFNTSADDMCFIDNNTGFYVGGRTDYFGIFKTTNGGNNWIRKDSMDNIFQIKFYDSNTGYVVRKYSQIKKTTNGGENWVWQTGVNWNETSSLCSIDANTWLIACSGDGRINKTTNGGINWNVLNFSSLGFFGPYSLYFINSTTGFSSSWKYGYIYKTTNAGDNWFQISYINEFMMSDGNLQFVNANTGYLGGWSDSGSVFKTTNGGYNWVPQKHLPNTSTYGLYFINAVTGFVGGQYGYIFKTTNGGSVFVSNISSEVPEKYSLSQNYPNPFNPTTNIKFSIIKVQYVTLKVHDMLGKEVATLVNETLKPGTYEVSFDGSQFTSGIYFYKITAGDFTDTKRMLMIK